jgi:type I site-specific restriction-modification system R (restriction) subunit
MLTQEQIQERLNAEYPHGINLRYVDYRDSLDEHPDMIKAIIESDHDYINEQVDKWYDDGDTISEVMKEVFTEEERDEQDLRDDVSQRCRDHDNEDPMKQLIKNSYEPLCYYDT